MTSCGAYPGGMADLARFLPFSNRPRQDESKVSTDRRMAVASLVDDAARMTAGRPDAAVLAGAFLHTSGLTQDAPSEGTTAERLAATAGTVRGGRRRGIRVLIRTTEALLRLAATIGVEPAIPAEVSGAVALSRAGTAPFERRAAISGHTVRATDAGWEFGRGPVLEAPALTIISFLLGVADEPPRRPRSDPRR